MPQEGEEEEEGRRKRKQKKKQRRIIKSPAEPRAHGTHNPISLQDLSVISLI
jgi:hypothetical protein